MPMVSVIMPVFNAGDGSELEQAIQSILQQTFADFELIICDDASTDDTWEHLQKWAAMVAELSYYRMRLTRKPVQHEIVVSINLRDDLSRLWMRTTYLRLIDCKRSWNF